MSWHRLKDAGLAQRAPRKERRVRQMTEPSVTPSVTPSVIRMAVCDDHELFRRGVVEMLLFAPDVEVVGEAADHEEAVAVVSELTPDVVLPDPEMPGGAIGADESMERLLGLSLAEDRDLHDARRAGDGRALPRAGGRPPTLPRAPRWAS
jgi:CheY-like chemotaxis protein